MARDRVLVTGASGFIAKHIVIALLRDGFDVRGTVRGAARADEVRRVVREAGEDANRCEFAKADLRSSDGWLAAATGCRYVLHTASPFPLAGQRGPVLIETARGGTDFALRAAAQAGAERAIVTASVASVAYGHDGSRTSPFGEDDFTNLESRDVSAYARSKTVAELLAWDVSRETGLALSTIHPGLVFGPVLDPRMGSSVKIVAMMLGGRVPLLPDITIPAVDVRDVALAHVRAMTAPDAGRRFMVVAPDTPSLPQIAAILADAFPERRSKIPLRRLPSWVLRLVAKVSSGAAMLTADSGKARTFDTRPAHETLGLSFIPAREAAVATAESLLRHGCV
ncbi:NAD-dependent epimerase/dehydratase family protein [Aureimonas sp. SK2]|uniref:NAD-dependent epimerase/dehydratase family protein n=1 Tax=Aureimonas sp. SK2 TaxID=3015992 RepID=UPI0024437805|nr:NAD-dependent epimerase/dehydratase family protein [Aureimonas sp. SK2]